MTARSFDRAYYERHYHDPQTAVASRDSANRLADFVCAYVGHMDIEVDTVLDLGCGIGLWQEPVGLHFPDAEYIGVEVSDYLCEEHGWQQGSVTDYELDGGADLVICQGVLQYLKKKSAKRALRNLARLTRGALYLEVLTKRDWKENVSQSLTDGDVHLRDVDFYLDLLDEHFVRCGGGVFVPRDADVVLYDLEHLDPRRQR